MANDPWYHWHIRSPSLALGNLVHRRDSESRQGPGGDLPHCDLYSHCCSKLLGQVASNQSESLRFDQIFLPAWFSMASRWSWLWVWYENNGIVEFLILR